jgi:hypothetical protein
MSALGWAKILRIARRGPAWRARGSVQLNLGSGCRLQLLTLKAVPGRPPSRSWTKIDSRDDKRIYTSTFGLAKGRTDVGAALGSRTPDLRIASRPAGQRLGDYRRIRVLGSRVWRQRGHSTTPVRGQLRGHAAQQRCRRRLCRHSPGAEEPGRHLTRRATVTPRRRGARSGSRVLATDRAEFRPSPFRGPPRTRPRFPGCAPTLGASSTRAF